MALDSLMVQGDVLGRSKVPPPDVQLQCAHILVDSVVPVVLKATAARLFENSPSIWRHLGKLE